MDWREAEGADGKSVILLRNAKTPADYVSAMKSHLDTITDDLVPPDAIS